MSEQRKRSSTPRLFGGKRKEDRALVRAVFAVWLILLGQVVSVAGLAMILEALIRGHEHGSTVLVLSLLFGGQVPAVIVFRNGVAAGLEVIGPHLPARFRAAPQEDDAG